MLHRITRQVWPAGGSLPHEEQLAAEFGVARGTIRRAMADLVQRGIVVRRRKAGTKVAARRAHSSTLTIPIVRQEIVDSGANYGYKLLTAKNGGNELDKTGQFSGAPLLHICCLHLSDERPYQLEDRLINLDAVPDAADNDFGNMSPNEWLVEKALFTHGSISCSAAGATKYQAQQLAIEPEDAVFIIQRSTWQSDHSITLVKLAYTQDFKMRTQI